MRIWILIRLKTVSYTHLDVYKRQVIVMDQYELSTVVVDQFPSFFTDGIRHYYYGSVTFDSAYESKAYTLIAAGRLLSLIHI